MMSFQTVDKKKKDDQEMMNKLTKENEDKKMLIKKAKDDMAMMDKLIKENEEKVKTNEKSMKEISDKVVENEKLVEEALIFMAKAPKQENVNMIKGWCKEEQGWTKVRSVMDSGCGTSVAPPGMCPAYPLLESEGSRRGQEFVSATEDVIPNLGQQKLNVVLPDSSETNVKYEIADVSRALNSISEICDAGHPEYGNHVVFGRRGGTIVNLESGKMTNFTRDGNIYCLDFWVKPFTRQGS